MPECCVSELLVDVCGADGVRRLIGLRPPSDRIPFAARSDSVRRPIGLRSPPDDFFNDKVRKCSTFMGKSLYLCAIYVLCNQ